MSSWGFGEWGFAPWGGALPLSCVPAGPQMQILLRSPAPAERDVEADRIVKIAFYDSLSTLDPSTVYITFNGVVAVSGTSFLNGFSGTAGYIGSVYTVQILNPYGWSYDSSYVTFARIQNDAAKCLEETWTWFTAADPICYGGLSPLEIELQLQQPLQRLLAADFLRKYLLNATLRTTNKAITQPDNKAARIIYQLAYSTELSTVLNAYLTRNEDALQVTVCERERAIVIDRLLAPYTDLIKQAINALENKGVVTKEHVTTFYDYLNSTNYNFRVSLVCNLVILSKALELRSLA